MANLKDLLVNGPSNLIGDVTVNKIRLTSLAIPTSSNGTEYGTGSNGKILKSNGTSVYWSDFSGDGSALTNLNASNISSGTINSARLPAVTRTNNTSTATPSHGGNITAIDSITTDSYGRVTAINTKTITLPSDNNTDILVKQTIKTDNTEYKILATSNNSSNAAEAVYNTGITINPSLKSISAAKINLTQTTNSQLGIDSNLKIEKSLKDLNFIVNSSSGTGINDGYAGGITWGKSNEAYAGIYYQSSSAYGTRLHFATTDSYANGPYTRILITHDGKVGIGTVTPSQKLEVNGNINVHNIYPIITEVYNLGDSTKKWNYVYANYFNGNGSNLTNLNANNIATGTLSTARGGTGSNSFAANRLIYTSNATTLSSTSNIYSDGSKLAINTTSMINNTDTFEVNGNSYLAGEVVTNGTISPVEDGTYDLGTEDCKWNKIYVNKFEPDVFLQNINITLSNTWQNIQSNEVDIELPYSGTYIIQIYDNTTSVGHYQAYWSGIFSWYTGNISGITNSDGYEYSEISLHGSGQAINTKNIYLRTYSQNSSKMKLQIKGNNNLTSSISNVISIKIKYIM